MNQQQSSWLSKIDRQNLLARWKWVATKLRKEIWKVRFSELLKAVKIKITVFESRQSLKKKKQESSQKFIDELSSNPSSSRKNKIRPQINKKYEEGPWMSLDSSKQLE